MKEIHKNHTQHHKIECSVTDDSHPSILRFVSGIGEKQSKWNQKDKLPLPKIMPQ